MTKPLTAETFIAWMWTYEYQFDSKADHSAFRNRFSRQIARLNEDAYRSDQSRPLTPDAITDGMVERAVNAYATRRWNDGAQGYLSHKHNDAMREALTLALTEPPARPAWQDLADEVEDLMTPPTPATPALFARLLYARGVRVVGGEDPR